MGHTLNTCFDVEKQHNSHNGGKVGDQPRLAPGVDGNGSRDQNSKYKEEMIVVPIRKLEIHIQVLSIKITQQ